MCLRIAAFTSSTVSAFSFASTSAAQAIVRPMYRLRDSEPATLPSLARLCWRRVKRSLTALFSSSAVMPSRTKRANSSRSAASRRATFSGAAMAWMPSSPASSRPLGALSATMLLLTL